MTVILSPVSANSHLQQLLSATLEKTTSVPRNQSSTSPAGWVSKRDLSLRALLWRLVWFSLTLLASSLKPQARIETRENLLQKVSSHSWRGWGLKQGSFAEPAARMGHQGTSLPAAAPPCCCSITTGCHQEKAVLHCCFTSASQFAVFNSIATGFGKFRVRLALGSLAASLALHSCIEKNHNILMNPENFYSRLCSSPPICFINLGELQGLSEEEEAFEWLLLDTWKAFRWKPVNENISMNGALCSLWLSE